MLDDIRLLCIATCYAVLIDFVTVRPGHDYRYSIDNSRIVSELDWQPVETFASGMRKTVGWYVRDFDSDPAPGWAAQVLKGSKSLARLGLGGVR